MGSGKQHIVLSIYSRMRTSDYVSGLLEKTSTQTTGDWFEDKNAGTTLTNNLSWSLNGTLGTLLSLFKYDSCIRSPVFFSAEVCHVSASMVELD